MYRAIDGIYQKSVYYYYFFWYVLLKWLRNLSNGLFINYNGMMQIKTYHNIIVEIFVYHNLFLQFESYLQKVFSTKFKHAPPTYTTDFTFHNSLLHEMVTFYWSIKVSPILYQVKSSMTYSIGRDSLLQLQWNRLIRP